MAIACSAALPFATPSEAAHMRPAANARNNGESVDSTGTADVYHKWKGRSGRCEATPGSLEAWAELGYYAARGRHVGALIGEETACGKTPKLGCAVRAADRARAGGKGSAMDLRIAFAPARPALRTFAVIAATAVFALTTVGVDAQTPPPTAPAPAAPAKKAQPKQPTKQPA